jgi:alkylation response protein AidB-like acyl-CoA dehydrogenase
MGAAAPPVDRARRLVEEHVRPALAEWEQQRRYPRDVVAASGLTALFVPAAAGGLELGYGEAMRVFEELGRGDAAFAFSLSMHNAVTAAVHAAGPAELVARWGGRLCSGAALGGFSLTEPHAGSDATAITSLAVPDGDRWRVSGTKAWVSLAAEADLFLVVCHT